MRINFWAFLLLGLFAMPSCSQKNKVKKQTSNNKIESEIDSLMNESKHENFRGSVLFSRNDNIVFHKSYGNQISNSTTTFWIGSMSKPFTAAAILKLQEENKLSVKDSLNKFIENVPSDKLGITLHHLLTHSSGLANNYVADGIAEREQAVSIILSSKLKNGIGEKFSYSAEGYNLLAIIIEIVSGESFEKYISKNIIAPAKLMKTGFWGFQDKPIVNIAPWNKPELMNNFLSTIFNEGKSQSNYGYKGATGISSTTQDLLKWITALRNAEILDSESLNLMFDPYVSARGDLTTGVFYGYGWFLEYKNGVLREIRHGGAEAGGIGHNGIIRSYQNGDLLIVLSNSGVYNGEGNLNGVEWGIALSFDLRDIIEAY